MSFKAFQWGPRYLTGIKLIDEQHETLVNLINGLGDIVLGEVAGTLDTLVAGIRDYARMHFASEEAIWSNDVIGLETQEDHLAQHLAFVSQLEGLCASGSGSEVEQARFLHDFLTGWLIRHILGEDRALAAKLIEQGVYPKLALNSEAVATGLANSEIVFLEAVENLYSSLSVVNERLREANSTLESRVQERTRELALANERLQAEHEALRQTNIELEETRSRLLETEKLASVGQLAAGVAHEINNPIGFVNSNLTSLSEYIEDIFALLDAYVGAEPLIARDPQQMASIRQLKMDRNIDFVTEDIHTLLAESREGLQRVKRIVIDLQAFSHVDQTAWQYSDICAGLDSTLTLIGSEIRHRAEIEKDFAALPLVYCNLGQINQVFMNLLMNATQAMHSDGGRIRVTARLAHADDMGKERVCVEIADNGVGIDPAHLNKIFEPFFTTKPVGKGTGLGLSLVWGVIAAHGGRIEVESTQEAGKSGTCFRIFLPVNGPEHEPGMLQEN